MPGTVRPAQVDEIHAGAAGIGQTVTVGMPHGAEAACGAMFGFAAIAPPVMTATPFGEGSGVLAAADLPGRLRPWCGSGGIAARNPPGLSRGVVGPAGTIPLRPRSVRGPVRPPAPTAGGAPAGDRPPTDILNVRISLRGCPSEGHQ